MSSGPTASESVRPVLLCFDGSKDAAGAIAEAGRMLSSRPAVVLTVWEPFRLWQPYDPATILTAPLEKLATQGLGLDELAETLAREQSERGATLARDAGFDASSRLACGRPWRAICHVAEDLEAEAIVVGARGLGRVESALLGGVSSAVVVHARRPVLVVPPRESTPSSRAEA